MMFCFRVYSGLYGLYGFKVPARSSLSFSVVKTVLGTKRMLKSMLGEVVRVC